MEKIDLVDLEASFNLSEYVKKKKHNKEKPEYAK